MKNQLQSNLWEITKPMPQQAAAPAEEADQQLKRICRIGKRLFGVASCIVTFGDGCSNLSENNRAQDSVEGAFCSSLPQPNGLVVVHDTCTVEALRKHPLVAGTPNIRFYVACPIHGSDNAVIGRISLVGYTPRVFGEDDRHLFADLARLVEREMQLRSLNATQLDLEKTNKNLRRKSLIDPLIGTWNRAAIMRILTIEAVRCDKAGMPLSLIVADLDFFKKINDTYGHPAGDNVLVKVASRLRSCIRSQEALGRYGGEEFLVVLPGSSISTAMAVAERMCQAVAAQPETIAGTTLKLSISAGVASTDVFPSATTEELISRADVALYAAKDAGRNCVMQARAD